MYRVEAIKPNPFRHLERYPINQSKIDALVASINATGFWDNVVARLDPNGVPELAYGHHRLEALKKAGVKECNLIIRDLDDQVMLKIMAHENMQEWGTDVTVMHETVRAVVVAYAEGRISLPAVKNLNSTQRRYAPGFIMGDDLRGSPQKPYDASTLTAFLELSDINPIKEALQQLAISEQYDLEPEEWSGLGPSKAHQASIAISKTAKAAEVTPEQAKAIIETVKNPPKQRDPDIFGNVGLPIQREMPDINQFSEQLRTTMEIHTVKLREVIENSDFLGKRQRANLIDTLKRLSRCYNDFAIELEEIPHA